MTYDLRSDVGDAQLELCMHCLQQVGVTLKLRCKQQLKQPVMRLGSWAVCEQCCVPKYQ